MPSHGNKMMKANHPKAEKGPNWHFFTITEQIWRWVTDKALTISKSYNILSFLILENKPNVF